MLGVKYYFAVYIQTIFWLLCTKYFPWRFAWNNFHYINESSIRPLLAGWRRCRSDIFNHFIQKNISPSFKSRLMINFSDTNSPKAKRRNSVSQFRRKSQIRRKDATHVASLVVPPTNGRHLLHEFGINKKFQCVLNVDLHHHNIVDLNAASSWWCMVHENIP